MQPPEPSTSGAPSELPAAIAAWRDDVLGRRQEFRVGLVDALWTQRYAVAIDDLDPSYFDEAAARSRGLRGLVAPPNYIATQRAAALPGPAESLMRSDGLPQESGPPVKGLAAMGGGQEFEFKSPVYCGETIVGDKEIVQVEPRAGRSGAMVVVVEQIRYFNADDGEHKLTLLNTVLYRLLDPADSAEPARA
ncbi:conserved hypothetical protein [Burkholderiales bacterium 8X]|nr:conserved hypothetical protein [Burkholderiales bacterium 8X]